MRLPSWFLNMSVGSRLGWGFAALVGLILALGGLTLSQMRDLAGQANLLFRHPFTVTRAVDEVEIQVLKIHREMKDLTHTLDPGDVRQHLARVGAHEKEALRQLETARQRFLGEPEEVRRVHDALVAWGGSRHPRRTGEPCRGALEGAAGRAPQGSDARVQEDGAA